MSNTFNPIKNRALKRLKRKKLLVTANKDGMAHKQEYSLDLHANMRKATCFGNPSASAH